MFEFLFKKKKRKVSLVLGGGGAKGFFHLGVINAIRDLDIEVVEISGTSIGAIVGTVFASNPNIDFNTVLDDINLAKFFGLVFNRTDERTIKKLQDLFIKYIKVSKFNELKIPMSYNATDIKTGKEIIFRSGDIFPSLIASMAIPFVFPLIKIDDKYLCDGGVVNNLPISLIKHNRKDVIASVLNSPLPDIKNFKDGIAVLSNAYYIMQKHDVDDSIEKFRSEKNTKIEIIELNRFMSTFDFRKSSIKNLMDLGYKEAMKVLK